MITMDKSSATDGDSITKTESNNSADSSVPTTLTIDSQEMIIYGPFHRIQTPTQTKEDAARQVESKQVWGRPRQHSEIPQVQAYEGPLPSKCDGIQFTTLVSPDRGTPPGQERWTGPRPGVVVADGFAKIQCHTIHAIGGIAEIAIVPAELASSTTTNRSMATVATAGNSAIVTAFSADPNPNHLKQSDNLLML